MRLVKMYLSLFLILALTATTVGAVELQSSKIKDFRAVWVASVYGIDYPKTPSVDSEKLKEQADEILKGAKELGMTAVILQVRPTADSLYNSAIFPWSKYLTGVQGVKPSNNFDPLSYWISEAHRLGLELHAWINPYRVANNESDYNEMVATHPAKTNKNWVVKHSDGKYYFNPGIKEVRELVIAGAQEIVYNYDIDGLHLDDYFYPDSNFADSETFAEFGENFDDVGDWRRNNINLLVSGLNDMVKGSKKDISFGVSPAGIWANSKNISIGSDTSGKETYFSSYADSLKWIKEGWVDYICPQLYWHIGYGEADYKTLALWWADAVKDTDVSLYIGMADYRAGNTEYNNPWNGIKAIKDELYLNSQIGEIKGEVHYNYQSLTKYKELYNLYKAVYNGLPVPEYNAKLDKVNHNAYISGDSGYFSPDKPLTRAEASTLLARLIVDDSGNFVFDKNEWYPAAYTDISEDKWYAASIGFMSLYNVVHGYEDGNFLPDKSITRAEFATLISRLEKMDTVTNISFSDVPVNHWAAASIAFSKNKGYISGYDDGTFRPEQPITRAETIKIINRMTGRKPDINYIEKQLNNPMLYKDVSLNHWAYAEIFEASVTHSYNILNGTEKWDTAEYLPQSKPDNSIFVSDKFTFIIPDLITKGELVPLDLNSVTAVAVHHMDHSTANFRDIEAWHLKRGFDAIGYNFWIDYNGLVYVGRGFNRGAAVANQNSNLISIGFQGDYNEINSKMPDAQFRAGVELIRWLDKKLLNINRVGGHSDYAATECPGHKFPLSEMIKQVSVKWRIGL